MDLRSVTLGVGWIKGIFFGARLGTCWGDGLGFIVEVIIFLLPATSFLPEIIIFPVDGSVVTEMQIECGQWLVSANDRVGTITAGKKMARKRKVVRKNAEKNEIENNILRNNKMRNSKIDLVVSNRGEVVVRLNGAFL